MRSSTVVESSPEVVEPYLTRQELEEQKRIAEIWDEHRAVLEEARKTIPKEGDKCPVHPLRKLKMKDVGLGKHIDPISHKQHLNLSKSYQNRRIPQELPWLTNPAR